MFFIKRRMSQGVSEENIFYYIGPMRHQYHSISYLKPGHTQRYISENDLAKCIVIFKSL